MSTHTQLKVLTATDIRGSKKQRRLTMLTAYDYPTASIADAAEMDMLLVGDSLAMVVLGHDDTLSVTMDEMIHHCRAVARGTQRALVVGDMPFMSYETGVEDAMRNAARMFREGGVRAVKLEGGLSVTPQIKALTQAGIPVVGHIGLTPQRVAALGGFKVQGRSAEAARLLLEDAKALEEAGCFALVLEAIPAPVARHITESISIPTIGIGAGADCDGQVLVFHDLLGLYDKFTPRFVKRYAELRQEAVKAIGQYRDEVIQGTFPQKEHSFTMPQEELEMWEKSIKDRND
ncbi:3-methyl-2-oxobutanoate hydroxymethyltransferase [Oleidesulfovibrio sp.]|uniref:3-methyl-2-oxobutanoate hydroxymethyltransferase n=1 Tax=Oleidesulfovibrio sp. TaxID=2909707 RepID=UPI003A89DD61